ncbi:unnamed protein product [Chrysodeixis includens]|uniref:Uncharacterized protein n=1 Tax=Chrysodeixis includens TaxID=689277 RepID=A0A9N8KWP2_CHRIL|nr:unnamed protein product [Chrysodeixis includens]
MVARPDGAALAAQQQAQLGGAEGAQAARREHGAEPAPERARLPPHAAARHPPRARLRVRARVMRPHLDVLAVVGERLHGDGGVGVRGHVRHGERELLERGALHRQRRDALRTLFGVQRLVAHQQVIALSRSQHVLQETMSDWINLLQTIISQFFTAHDTQEGFR